MYKDKERTTKIQTLVDKLQDGYRTNSIINDVGKKGISNVFSKASGNIKLYELGETVRTTQCPSCLRYAKKGTIFCLCGKCLMPRLNKEKIKNRIGIISNPLYVIKGWSYRRTSWTKTVAICPLEGERCNRRSEERNFEPIEHRWLADPAYQESQVSHG